MKSGTPLWKLRHSSIRSFFEKYTLFKTPNESRIRSVYLEKEADREEEMRMCLKNEYICVSIDETTDSCERYVAVVLAGALEIEHLSKPFMVLCEELEQVSQTTIS